MDDDLNTPRAIAALFDLAHYINRGSQEGRDVDAAQGTLRELAGILGLTLREPEDEHGSDVGPLVELLIETRADLRDAKQYDLADRIREKLAEAGYELEDTATGTEWKRGAQ